ncbi:MAG TPA: hypothetical protein VF644_14425 [Pyrinomonadaceae bacterium]|jgi:hypothetical protein
MKQEEKIEDSKSVENQTNVSEEESNREESATDMSPLADSGKADNLPVESIGSYARIDELLDGEGTERRGQADSKS